MTAPRRKAILVSFTAKEWADLHAEAKRTGRSMSALAAAAWVLARRRLQAMPSFAAQLDRLEFQDRGSR